MFLKRPRNLFLALGHGGTVETAQSSTDALCGCTVGGPSLGRQSLTGPETTDRTTAPPRDNHGHRREFDSFVQISP
jgi:hypothetical protein